MVLLAVAVVLFATRIAVGVWDVASPDARPELVAWASPDEAARAAQSGGRLVLYAFVDPTQAESRKLSHEVFASPNLAPAINREFVPVRIAVSSARPDADTEERLARFKVTAIPALVVTSPDGDRFKSLSGFHDARATHEFLQEAKLEVLGLPFMRGGGFQFRVGGRDSLAFGGAPGAEADSVLEGGGR
jgi:hypothetical protein